jgi:hypothetical protein
MANCSRSRCATSISPANRTKESGVRPHSHSSRGDGSPVTCVADLSTTSSTLISVGENSTRQARRPALTTTTSEEPGPIAGEHQYEHLVDPIDPKFKGSRADDQTSRYERTCPKSLVHPTLATFRPVLVGWSMGAMVAWEYVKRYGCDSVAGLVVVDQPPSDFSWEGYEFGLMTVEGLAENVKGIQTDQRAVAETFADLMQHVPLPELPAGPYLPVSCCVRT